MSLMSYKTYQLNKMHMFVSKIIGYLFYLAKESKEMFKNAFIWHGYFYSSLYSPSVTYTHVRWHSHFQSNKQQEQ